MRVLAVAQLGLALQCQHGARRWHLLPLQPPDDGRVVGGGAEEGGAGQVAAQLGVEAAGGNGGGHLVVLAGRGHHSHPGVVLGGGPDQGRSPDVDLLDRLLVGDGLLRHGRLERVEVDDDELDGGDAAGVEVVAVFRLAEVGEDRPMDHGMEGLDPAAQHLGSVGHVRHRGDRKAGLPQHPGGPARRHQLGPALDQGAGELHEPGLVPYRQQGAAHRDPAHGPSQWTWRPATRSRPAAKAATTSG